MDPITLAMGIATLVPDVMKWLGHENAAASAEKIVSIAQKVTGTSSGDAALSALKDNPALGLQLQQELNRNKEEMVRLSQVVTLAEIDADKANTATVNETMRAEVAAEHWPSYTWRPFIGFCFGVTLLICVLVVSVVFVAVMLDPEKINLLDKLPPFINNMAFLLGVPMPILGIASYFRGKMQADPNIPTINRG